MIDKIKFCYKNISRLNVALIYCQERITTNISENLRLHLRMKYKEIERQKNAFKTLLEHEKKN
jgi:hypothetical protein